VPLLLFQAEQSSLLPKLAGLASSGRLTDFRSGLKRLVLVVVAIGVAATVGAFIVGPFALRIAFGSEYDKLNNFDIGYLALASSAVMLAQALAQALIALRGHAKAALGWVFGIVVFAVATALGNGLLARVELGLVSGSLVAVLAMAVLLRAQMRAGVPSTVESVLRNLGGDAEIIEP
jgi:O-antigen/teichoic acid export membrane protein